MGDVENLRGEWGFYRKSYNPTPWKIIVLVVGAAAIEEFLGNRQGEFV